jgi:type IX secretion system PorP/SprF family membrane protein
MLGISLSTGKSHVNFKTEKMKKFIIYSLILVSSWSYGQEMNLPVWTQYLADNDFIISPTYAGIGDDLKVRLNGLTQWVGIKDAPDNQALYADFRISDRTGVGLSFYNDKNGNTRQKGAKFSFAHHLTLSYTQKMFLSLGLSYNINSFRIAIEDIETINGTPIVDPAINGDRSKSNHNFDVGFLYRFEDFYLSLNANNLLEKDLDDFTGAEPGDLLNFQVYSGFVLRSRANKSIEYEPSVFFQMFWSDKRSATDLNFKFRQFNRNEDYYWIGGSYRFLNDQFFTPLNVGPMAGITKNKFYFAYSYQFTINDLAGYNSGTHAITIGIDFLQGASSCACTKGTSWKTHKRAGTNY